MKIMSLNPALLFFLAIYPSSFVFASVTVRLSPDLSTAAVGTTVTWSAQAADSSDSNATFTYQFSVGTSAGTLQVRRDFSSASQFAWTEPDQEGTYDVQVIAKKSSGVTAATAETFVITPIATGSSPVVSSTNHPLVALYSAPAQMCPAGAAMQVSFRNVLTGRLSATSYKSCNGTSSINFYIGGMRSNSRYSLQHHVISGSSNIAGPVLIFKTGFLPSAITFKTYNVPLPEPSTAHPIVLTSPTQGVPFATDTERNILWYLPVYQNTGGYLTRPVPGGTFLGTADDDSGIAGNRRLLREYDMAGNTIRETSTAAISAQLVSRFGTDPITSIHHEVFRFPNGDTGLLGSVEKLADQGAGQVDVFGDIAIVLDSNLQVKWFWNEFDHLDITRPAILGEICAIGNQGCPHLYKSGYTSANDWTHSNALAPTPDGNLVISIRHQDWIVKINYANGTGDGSIIWKLGREGDFTYASTDDCPWFSHQHDSTFSTNGLLTLFDNGNSRVTKTVEFCGNGSTQMHSRGQSWSLDEKRKVATPVLNLDLGAFSPATGSAAHSPLGNYFFFLGFINSATASSREYSVSGAARFQMDFTTSVGYRSFRMANLYSLD